MFLCADKQSSVRFADVRRSATGANESIQHLLGVMAAFQLSLVLVKKTPPLSQSNDVYEFICPCCNSSYIGKTNRTLLLCTQEHTLTDKSCDDSNWDL